MPLSVEFIDQVKERNPIDEVMRDYVTLKRAGRYQKCLCPFHSERTPSCVVYTDDNSWFCFGCRSGGDVITFIMKIENLDYVEAVRFLAARAGLQMPEDGFDDRVGKEKKRLAEINKTAARYYFSNLTVPEGKEGLTYLLQKRRLKPETVKSFGIGVALNHWTALKNHMLSLGYTEGELLRASLLSEKNGRTFDFFVNRVMFPIFDLRGNVIAFSGRTLEQNPSGGKYLNSRETPLYKKSRTLFALNFAKNEAVKSKRLILCEGNIDVVSLHQAGFKDAVATCGTAITGEHARLMAQYCGEVYICYDSDAAGVSATRNAISVLSAAGLSTKIVRISGEGVKDVDDYINRYGPDHFKVLLGNSEGSTEYELQNARNSVDTSSDFGKVEYLKKAAQVLADIENRIEREVYISRVANEQGISREVLEAEMEGILKKKTRQSEKKAWHSETLGPRRDEINPESREYPKQTKAENGVISYIFSHQDRAGEIFLRLSPDEFITSFNKRLYGEMKKLYEKGLEIGLSGLGSEFSADEMGRITSIMASSKSIPVNSEALEDFIAVIKQGVPKEQDEISEEDFTEYFEMMRKQKTQK